MNYHLKPLGKACAATGKELVPGMTCHSALVEKHGELIRIDFSQEGWDGPPEGTVGHWHFTVPHVTESKTPSMDANSLMRYFEQLGEDLNPAQEKFRYILSLLLLQKKKLKIQNTRLDEDIEYVELIGIHGEGPFEVKQQNLSTEEIEQLQQELNSHLAAELN
jgi:hypothetical protein